MAWDQACPSDVKAQSQLRSEKLARERDRLARKSTNASGVMNSRCASAPTIWAGGCPFRKVQRHRGFGSMGDKGIAAAAVP